MFWKQTFPESQETFEGYNHLLGLVSLPGEIITALCFSKMRAQQAPLCVLFVNALGLSNKLLFLSLHWIWMKRLAVSDVNHHTEEILQALRSQGVERNFPGMFLVKSSKVLIGDADGVVATLLSVMAGL
jgi:hypothetical protein